MQPQARKMFGWLVFFFFSKSRWWKGAKLRCRNTREFDLPSPPLQMTALESPTFATTRRSPTRMAVEAVDPESV